MVLLVAQLVEQLLTTQQVSSLNPVIDKFYNALNCIEKMIVKKKGAENDPINKLEVIALLYHWRSGKSFASKPGGFGVATLYF